MIAAPEAQQVVPVSGGPVVLPVDQPAADQDDNATPERVYDVRITLKAYRQDGTVFVCEQHEETLRKK
jgi:hypothetical protein